jgi:hypothetical protein
MTDEPENSDTRSVRIWLEPPFNMTGPMGTAIISRVPTYRVQRDDWEKSVFCTVSRLPKKLAACGMTDPAIEQAVERAQTLEDPGDFIVVVVE